MACKMALFALVCVSVDKMCVSTVLCSLGCVGLYFDCVSYGSW